MEREVLTEKLRSGSIALHQLEDHVSPAEAAEVRLSFLSMQTGCDLGALSTGAFSPDTVFHHNIENLSGTVGVPLGVAGPIPVRGRHAHGSFYVPMATTEGALVAGVSRGAKVMRASDAVTTTVEYRGMTRAPLFRVASIATIDAVTTWIDANLEQLRNVVRSISQHAVLLAIEPYAMGRELWLRMVFDTGEAMGMNMATQLARAIATTLTDTHDGLELVALSGNVCVDKKANWINVFRGRGYRVAAEVVVPVDVVTTQLHTSVDDIVAVTQQKVWHGGAMSASQSFNAQIANVIAATFIATGQDAAHIVDSSVGFTIAEREGSDLYLSVTLPNVLVGAVGGGTNLPAQAAARHILCANIDDPTEQIEVTDTSRVAHRMAEVIGAAVLCGELNLLGAIAADELVSAHQELGRSNANK